MARTLDLTLTHRDGTTVPMVGLRPVEVRAALLGGRTRSGGWAAAGWDDARCVTCGDVAAFCPDVQRVLSTTLAGRVWLAERQEALVG
jgi:hypothetical protein